MRIKKNCKNKGFTLLELLVAIVIISVVILVAIPSYLHYVKRQELANTIKVANSLQATVAVCILKNKSPVGCDSDSNDIAVATESGIGQIGLSVKAGVITATVPMDVGYDIPTDTNYILTPIVTDGKVSWQKSGTACQLINCEK